MSGWTRPPPRLRIMERTAINNGMALDESSIRADREDHRVRVARERRERMHAHLLRSIMAVYSDSQSNASKVIDDVVGHAGVSRGTFYKHFRSLEEGISEVGADLAHEMTVGIASIHDLVHAPHERVGLGSQLFMRRALFDPIWGGFFSHIGLLCPGNAMIRNMTDDIRRGITDGLFDVPGVECGLDLLIGTKVQAIRRIVRGDCDTAYVETISQLILRGLGLSPTRAEKTIEMMSALLETEAPARVSGGRGRQLP